MKETYSTITGNRLHEDLVYDTLVDQDMENKRINLNDLIFNCDEMTDQELADEFRKQFAGCLDYAIKIAEETDAEGQDE